MWGENGSGEDLMGSLDRTRLIGRDDESAQLDDAMAAVQDRPQVVLIVGDAGIGKTSLVSRLALRAADLGFVTAVGHCLDIEAAMSFAPVIEAVRTALPDDAGLPHRPHARRMRALLDPDAPQTDQVRMLEDLRLTILETAAQQPLLLILEDLHWADRSTQDLVSALARTARGRLLLVLTVRSDELHRRHPFRAALAELSRLDTAQRIDLGPLDRDDVAALLHERSGTEGGGDVVASVHERSEGNPLYVEELADADPDAVPEHLSDLLLARVAKLSSESRAVVRAASADGSRLDIDLLASVTGLEAGGLEEPLRHALDGHVLRQRGGVLEFRHGLLREAVYDDLLPGERTRTHAAFAEALQARVDEQGEASLSQLSRSAFHWSQAHDPARTLAASVRAGERALHFGTAESVTHLDRAVSLWDTVTDAELVAGRTKPDLLLLLAHACADNERRDLFEALTREAVAELTPDTDRLVASRVYATLTLCPPAGGDRIDDAEALRLALEYAGTIPSRELAQALRSQSAYHHRRGHGAPALEAAEQAVRVARQADDPVHEVEALHFCAVELDLLGRVDEAVASEREAVRVARQAGRLGHALFEESNLAWYELVSGATGSAYQRAIARLEESLANALPLMGFYTGAQAFAFLIWQGRFDDATGVLNRLALLDVDSHWDWRTEFEEALAIARGDVDTVARRFGELPRFVQSGAPHSGDDEEVDLRVAGLLMRGEMASACELAESYLTFVERGDSPARHAAAALTAYRAWSQDPKHDLGAHAERSLELARARLTDEWRTTLHGLRFTLADAYRSRFHREPAVESLREAVNMAEPFGSYVALEARLLLAEELLAHGERDEGRELLTAVWADAKAMGAGDHERRAFRLAIRTRVPLAGADTPTGPLARLTPREREVLDLLADGASNRAISETLFITEKTASVHVSNVLAKLGVPNRGGAAALARRLE
jgi:DNA-binding CsgD family transcriptional regulator/type II secretory pathway predicted ATPase ExeA